MYVGSCVVDPSGPHQEGTTRVTLGEDSFFTSTGNGVKYTKDELIDVLDLPRSQPISERYVLSAILSDMSAAPSVGYFHAHAVEVVLPHVESFPEQFALPVERISVREVAYVVARNPEARDQPSNSVR